MRVARAQVLVGDEAVAAIGRGQATLVGFGREDGPGDLDWMVYKLHALRIFADESGRLRHSADDLGLQHLVVPQFTLYGDVARGHRPDFGPALPPDAAKAMWREFLTRFGSAECGIFGADMRFLLENDGPVTILLDSRSGRERQSAAGAAADGR